MRDLSDRFETRFLRKHYMQLKKILPIKQVGDTKSELLPSFSLYETT